MLGEDDAGRVLRLFVEEHIRLVDPGELLVRVPRRNRVQRGVVEEADGKDEVVARPARREHVRNTLSRRLRHVDARRNPELPADPQSALVRKLVERAILELPDVGDDRHLEVRLLDLRRPGRADDQRAEGDERQHYADHRCAYFHVPSLEVSLPP